MAARQEKLYQRLKTLLRQKPMANVSTDVNVEVSVDDRGRPVWTAVKGPEAEVYMDERLADVIAWAVSVVLDENL